MIVNIHDAKTHLSRLVERAAAGEEIIIGRSGSPVARLVPYSAVPGPRRPGRWARRVKVAADFDSSPDWLLDAFEGE